MSSDEGGLTHTTITNQNHFELRNLYARLS
jgi:hypothetical protein